MVPTHCVLSVDNVKKKKLFNAAILDDIQKVLQTLLKFTKMKTKNLKQFATVILISTLKATDMRNEGPYVHKSQTFWKETSLVCFLTKILFGYVRLRIT